MRTVCKANGCNGCMACANCCPKHCIEVVDNIKDFNAIIDEKKCVSCGICKKICPNITMPETKRTIYWKQGWAQPEIRKNSTSGGAAAAFATSFLDVGGYVASCYFDNGSFIFGITNNKNDAKKFSGSKYVKSNPDGIYEAIRKKLEQNRVLFIGLPCQVAALKNYIGDNENLYTVDLICHGTPSVKLLDIFLKEKEIDLKDIRNIKFRTKTDMGITKDERKLAGSRVIDDYLCAFLESVDYTENCYSCKFASLDRVSDVTIGDSWGTEYSEEEKNGVSLILAQTVKGIKLIENSKMELRDVDLENAIRNNHQLSEPSKLTPKRDKFFSTMEKNKNFSKAVFCAVPWLVLKQKIKSILVSLHIMKINGGGYETIVSR